MRVLHSVSERAELVGVRSEVNRLMIIFILTV